MLEFNIGEQGWITSILEQARETTARTTEPLFHDIFHPQIMSMISKHYHAHPLIPTETTFRSQQEIWQDSETELYTFRVQYQVMDCWVYLADDWYLWARNAVADRLPVRIMTT